MHGWMDHFQSSVFGLYPNDRTNLLMFVNDNLCKLYSVIPNSA